MKKEDLFRAMEDIDPVFIEEGNERPSARINGWKGWVRFAVAAAAVLLIGGASLLYLTKGPAAKPKAPIEKHVAAEILTNDEIQEIPHWEDMMDVQRFSSLSYDGKEYRTRLILVHEENVGEALGTGVLTGFDDYAETVHTVEGRLNAVRGIDTEAAVCVTFPAEPGRAYAYVNTAWTPGTLGEFIEKLSLRETLKTNRVLVPQSSGPDIVYEDVPAESVWRMLMDGAEATANEGPDFEPGRKVLTVSVTLDLLGNHHNKALSLTEDGYLMTNLLDSGKYFFIGKDKVNAFVREVTENHQGYIYIYDVPTGGYQTPENATEETEAGLIEVQTKPAE